MRDEINSRTNHSSFDLYPQIPAGQGPFLRKEDALRIGFVVMNRLQTKNDFPSIYLGDLYFLKIIDLQG
jgi:hypothetical protein